jgi:hypothetical protein
MIDKINSIGYVRLMKYKILTIFFIFSCGIKSFSQENIIDMLLLGKRRHIELYYNGELDNNIYNLVYTAQIDRIENGFYKLEINNTYFRDYYIFKITDIKVNGKIIKGKLIEIWHRDAEGNPYCDESGNEIVYENGNVEIDINNNIVAFEITFFMYGLKYNNKIILKNNA